MEKQPSVTVLVTVKNSKETIERCVKSLLNLKYKNYRIYITDAFSTDGTWEELEKIKERHPKKIRLERIRGNIAKAHNHMIERTNTEFIAITDADCIVDKNWLKNLISGFSSKEIIATAGYCSTPKTVNTIQRLIGRELEGRFDNFPKFILRAPTMNLCVRTEVAKKVKFDERFDVAQETDWGYRLAKFGRMRYVSKAVVYHHHRATLKGFFKQQFRYGRNMPLLYFKHMRMSTGDHISKPIMIFQEFIFIFACLFSILYFFNPNFFILPISLFTILFISYIIKSVNLAKNIFEIPLFFFLFFFRTVAWAFGLVFGIFDLILKRR